MSIAITHGRANATANNELDKNANTRIPPKISGETTKIMKKNGFTEVFPRLIFRHILFPPSGLGESETKKITKWMST